MFGRGSCFKYTIMVSIFQSLKLHKHFTYLLVIPGADCGGKNGGKKRQRCHHKSEVFAMAKSIKSWPTFSGFLNGTNFTVGGVKSRDA